MDFAVLPPEVNSARMYAGPGSPPMLAASVAWDALAAELNAALASYTSVVTGLAADWRGPSSAAMTAAASGYLQWMGATAAQAEQTAAQARRCAGPGIRCQRRSRRGGAKRCRGRRRHRRCGPAASIGGLSVPATWAAGAQSVTPPVAVLPNATLATAVPPNPGGMLGGVPLAGMAARANNAVVPRTMVPTAPHVVPRPAFGG